MTWYEFRQLPLKEQDEIMTHYEMHVQYELKHLQESFYVNSDIYKQEEKRLRNMSLNEFLEELKYNKTDGVWELKENI